MKKFYITLVALFVFSIPAWAQEEAPASVQKNFKSKYSKARDVEWVKTADNQWQADFKQNDNDVQVVFDEKGTWLGSRSDIDVAKVPQAVKTAVAEKYKGYTIQEVEKVEVLNGETMYKMALISGDRMVETMFHADGRIVMSASDKEVEEREIEEMDDDY